MMRYMIVGADTLDDLEDAVNAQVRRGYLPQGGVFRAGRGKAYLQAMWLPEEGTKQKFTRAHDYNGGHEAFTEECSPEGAH